jgi:phosphoribosyl 1,2-cyclic phosphodiesterase
LEIRKWGGGSYPTINGHKITLDGGKHDTILSVKVGKTINTVSIVMAASAYDLDSRGAK